MAAAARDAGLEYIAITDHSQSLAMANGLDERRALEHAARIRALDARGRGVRLLAGIECDIKPDGTLDLADDCLAALDIVVASVHSAFNQDRQQMTERLLRAHREPARRHPRPPDRPPDSEAASRTRSTSRRSSTRRRGTASALEINCQVDRLDLNDVHARLARDRGVPLVDLERRALAPRASAVLRWGVARRAARVARAAGRPEHAAVRRVLRASLRRNRSARP